MAKMRNVAADEVTDWGPIGSVAAILKVAVITHQARSQDFRDRSCFVSAQNRNHSPLDQRSGPTEEEGGGGMLPQEKL